MLRGRKVVGLQGCLFGMGCWGRVWRVLKREKGDCVELYAKAGRGLEVIAILDQGA